MQGRNRPFTDKQLDQLLPTQGFDIILPPQGYDKHAPRPELYEGYRMPQQTKVDVGISWSKDLPAIKAQQLAHFGKLLQEVDESKLTIDQQKERKVMALLLKIKNGDFQVRKLAMRQMSINARLLGAESIFSQLLPLMISSGIDDQQRHLLVRTIDRVLSRLQEQVRPYTHNILKVVQPMLMDQNYYARVEGRQIISNLTKAAGLPTIISCVRKDIDSIDANLRNITARALAVIGSALGISQILPFVKAVCQSKNWTARQTGIKVIQQIAILIGCSVLPFIKLLVQIVQAGLKDQQKKVRTASALAISSLAQASHPYGIQAFESVLMLLWEGLNQNKDKTLCNYLKAIGFIIPLMQDQHAKEYSLLVIPCLVKQFTHTQQQIKNTVLIVLKQFLNCRGVETLTIKQDIEPQFIKYYWVRKNSGDKRNYRLIIQNTVILAGRIGVSTIIGKLVFLLKDDNQPSRNMSIQAINKIAQKHSLDQLSLSLQQTLMDSMIYAFHQQSSQDNIMVNGMGSIINVLGERTKPYFEQLNGILHWRLNNKSAKTRQLAAQLISHIAHCMKQCNQDGKLGRLGGILFQGLGQQYPQVLGSILKALSAIVEEVGMNKMNPPIKQLLPRLTPILRNRHQKVEQNIVDLIGKIASKGADHVSPRQWMRVCFDLLDLLKAPKKKIRRAAILTFGHIAQAIGPQDVLVTLLNNLKVQQRQLRICTTVAIAIIAQSCGPFTVLPALMNQYRVQQLNVQNGVLKSISFMMEYIGQINKDYIYCITPLIQDALLDRDIVHRQTAINAIKHLALGVQGMGCQDALFHLLNYLWPNIFQTSTYIQAVVLQTLDALRVAIGPGYLLLYLLQGLWHPARRIRVVYWRIYNMLIYGSQEALVPFYPSFGKSNPLNSFI